MAKRKKRGKAKRGRFLQISHFMLGSAAWRSLPPLPRALYIEVHQRYDGFNNGSIGLGVREAGEALHVKPHTAGLAFDMLVERGFLALTKNSSFGQKKLAREWRLTCLPAGAWDSPTAPPTHDYMRWRPSQDQKQKLVPFRDTLSALSGNDHPPIDAEALPTVPLRGTKAASLSAAEGHTSMYHQEKNKMNDQGVAGALGSGRNRAAPRTAAMDEK